MKKTIIIIFGLIVPFSLFSQSGLRVEKGMIKAGSGSIITVHGGSSADLHIEKPAKLINDGIISIEGDLTNNSVERFADDNTIEDGEFHFNGSTVQIIGGTQEMEFENIRFKNTSATGITLAQAINISGNAEFLDGRIHSDTINSIHFLDGSSVSGASDASYVEGPAMKSGGSDFTFPVGKFNLYRSIGISALSGQDTFTAEYFHHDPDLDGYSEASKVGLYGLSDCEYWNLSPEGSTKAIVILSYNNNLGCIVSDLPDMRVAHWTGSSWISEGNSYYVDNGLTGYIHSDIVTSFSPFTLGTVSGKNILPVELLSYDVKCMSEEVEVSWATATETNNDYFIIESSADAKTYTVEGIIPGMGNSLIRQNYHFTLIDTDQKRYLRLTQVDFDGSSEIIGERHIRCKGSEYETGFEAYSTSNETIRMELKNPADANTKVRIFDARGIMLAQKYIPEGSISYEIENPDVNNTAYAIIIQLITNSETTSRKIVN
jgi:hypothetical protein